MKPYYQDKYATIYLGDCLELLPEMPKVDLVLTDPPYGVGGVAKGFKGKQRQHKISYSCAFKDTRENIIDTVVPAFLIALSISKRAILTPGPKQVTLYPAPDSFGVFYQPASCAMQSWGRADSQPIFYYGKDPRGGKTIQFCSLVLTESPEKNGHPCPKPFKAWKWLLNRGSVNGETILDPFMGSGTTLLAAKQLNRQAIGIEIEEKYCEIAAQRLSQEVLDLATVAA